MTERDEALRAIERELGVLIRRVRRVIGDVAQQVHPDLQPAAYLLLAHLGEAGPVRSVSVVDALGIDKGAVSRQIHHLVELGLVERSDDPDDGRATLLAVSADGRRRLDHVRAERSARFERLLGTWSAEDLGRFAGQLGRYNTALEQP